MEFFVKLFNAFRPSSDAYLFMWAILVAAIFTVSLVVDRFWMIFRRSGRRPEAFTKDVIDAIKNDDIAGAVKLCDRRPAMALAGIFKAGLSQAEFGIMRIRNAIEESMLKTVPDLEKLTGYLAVIGNVSTLLGLLGTVFGLIMSFAAVGKPGIDATQKSELLASGIATAMNATFCGLSVAIIAIIIYANLKAKTQKIIDELDEYSMRVINTLKEKSFQTAKYHISASEIKEGLGLHVRYNSVKIFADNKLIKEVSI